MGWSSGQILPVARRPDPLIAVVGLTKRRCGTGGDCEHFVIRTESEDVNLQSIRLEEGGVSGMFLPPRLQL